MKLINAYGPTEGTVCATTHEYLAGDLNTNIGQVVPNALVYILDQRMNPVPMGVTGTLYLGGAGLSRGYLNNPSLTDLQFIHLTMNAGKSPVRLYNTGDLVRWLPSGDVQYLGRDDGQVKIRGYRIELGEIEQAICRIPGVRQSCVLSCQRQTDAGVEKYLVGYYVCMHWYHPIWCLQQSHQYQVYH